MALNAFCVCCVMGKWVPSSALKRRGWRCNGRDWHTLLEFCSIVGALLIDAEAVYDPRLTNDRLLLGMKGTISEMEFAELGSVRQVYFWLDQQHIQLPVVRGSEEVREIVWLPAR